MKTLYHIKIARAAFGNHITPRAMDWILRGDFNTDFYGSLGWKILQHKVFPLYPFAKYWYKPIDHLDLCDGLPMLSEGWRELIRRINEIADDSAYPAGDARKMLIKISRAAHSLSDIYAHSTFIELLYEYYRNDPAASAEVQKSGLSVQDYIIKSGPLFSEVDENKNGKYNTLRTQYLEPKIFSDECLPDDTGPRSHEEINKDCPTCKMASNPDYPGIFEIAMALATRDTAGIVGGFFDKLKTQNPEKHKALTTAMPGELTPPGPFEKRAIFWSKKFGGYE